MDRSRALLKSNFMADFAAETIRKDFRPDLPADDGAKPRSTGTVGRWKCSASPAEVRRPMSAGWPNQWSGRG